MKVIKIKRCFDCPLSAHTYKGDKVFSICESGSNLRHTLDEIEINEPIPKWCPLDDK